LSFLSLHNLISTEGKKLDGDYYPSSSFQAI
jgi:hypothetical protein